MNNKVKICHFSSAHVNNDVRIFIKECISLSEVGYDTYFVAQGESREECGVHVIGVGNKPLSRLKRMFGFSRTIYETALNLNCDIYHFHDPELLPYGIKLKHEGKKVIYDSHEETSAQIMDKQWIPKMIRPIVSMVYRLYETHSVKQFDAVIAATPKIAKSFEGRAKRVVTVNNYPKLNDIKFCDTPFRERDSIVCYAGGINENRGERIMLEAMKDIDAKLVLAGPKLDGNISEDESGKYSNTVYVGVLDRNGINELYGKSVVGLVILKPIRNYIESLPIKMFEYMASGIPFIASDFPLWKHITEETGAGICVAYDDEDKLHEKILYFLTHREEAEMMGKKGRYAVEKLYSWNNEGKKLIDLYENVIENNTNI